jgi:hypothetical protein
LAGVVEIVVLALPSWRVVVEVAVPPLGPEKVDELVPLEGL